ncbi:efflux RND transporter periplasmic adaptor subunit [Alteromonas sp. 009811495]|uniref:efflux RND transporter periplasmic adaptor subunit n=1 Tax=Alteromonas sp. 009811495 TaxID=3002962 RepID=UPI00237EBCFB|nr:efflux RND transporter periplasmic adaptor subunit [Alteromonas sp. 009811495]WDT86354.1 efflux RND transporter periplasmic adaptor subunit [Alteromonas sp. 009811495]
MKNSKLVWGLVLLGISSPFLKLAAESDKQKYVEVAQVTKGDLDEHLVATGKVSYDRELNLDSKVVSTVTQVFVEVGERVSKGDTLLELDSFTLDSQEALLKKQYDSLDIELSIARGKAQDTERQHQINQTLMSKGLIGKEKLAQSQQALTNANLEVKHISSLLAAKQVQLDEVQGSRRYLTIKAPMDGLIIDLNAVEGENVYPNQMNVDFNFLVSMADNSSVFADVQIDERSLANVHIGQSASVFLASYPDTPIEGKISFIYPTVDKSSQGIRNKVRVELNQNALAGLNFRQNMSCLVKIKLATSKEGTLVPMKAVVEQNDAKFVYVLNGNAVRRQLIQAGESDFQLQRIVSGLSESDKVVVGPMDVLLNLTDGESVRIL